jgi:endonuclease YncB( thermonuclease family)
VASSAHERSVASSEESTRERVRGLLQAEVDRQGALEDTRRAIVLIGESSIRYSGDTEPGFFIAGPDGEPRTWMKDGRAVPFTLTDLAAELRRNYPTLFKPHDPDEAAAAPSREAIKAPPPRDWLLLDSGEPPSAEPEGTGEAAVRQAEQGSGSPVEAVPSNDERIQETGAGHDSVQRVIPESPVRKSPDLELVPDILPHSGWFRPSYAVYAGVALLVGTILAFIVFRPGSDFEPTSASAPPAKPAPSTESATAVPAHTKPPGALSGVPEVVDTSTLRIEGKIVRLFGVEWERGAQAEDLTRYIAGREVSCTPVGGSDRHRCVVEGRDLSQVVLYNGGGRATAEATPELKAAEANARSGGLGIWHKP